MRTEILTDVDRKLLELFRNADEKGKECIMNMLRCMVQFGDEFMVEMSAAVKRDDPDEINAILRKWCERLEVA